MVILSNLGLFVRHATTPPRWVVVSLLVLALAVTACGGGQQTVWDGPPKSDAEAAYRDALENMESSQFIEATKHFNKLRLEFPFSSRWTTLAELRLADVLLEQSRYAAAAESYRQFINSHPTHEDVPYAQYRIGLCHYEQMPSDFFLLPDPWQRQLESARQAEAALRRFITAYPESTYAPDAQEKLQEVRENLALHQLYVAEFYFRRDAIVGARNRLLELMHRYPNSSAVAPGLFLLGRAYIIERDVPAAAAALTLLVAQHPESEHTDEAKRWLEQNGLQDVEPMTLGRQ